MLVETDPSSKCYIINPELAHAYQPVCLETIIESNALYYHTSTRIQFLAASVTDPSSWHNCASRGLNH